MVPVHSSAKFNKVNFEKYAKLQTPTSPSSQDNDAGIKLPAIVAAALHEFFSKNNKQQAQKQLTESEVQVVDVSDEANGNDATSSAEEKIVSSEKQNAEKILVIEPESEIPNEPVTTPKVVPVETSSAGPVKIEEPKKGLLQTLSQHKVAIAAASALTVLATGGAVAAYCLNPVATAAIAAKVLTVGSVAVMGTHTLFILPGFVNAMFIGSVLMKLAIIPAAQFTAAVLLPIISTALVVGITSLIFLYVANRVWEFTRDGAWNVGSATLNFLDKEADKTYLGKGIKGGVKAIASPFITLAQHEWEEVDEANLALQSSEESEEGDEQSLETGSMETKKTARIKAQKKTEKSFGRKVFDAGLMTVGLGAGAYLVYKMMPDLEFLKK